MSFTDQRSKQNTPTDAIQQIQQMRMKAGYIDSLILNRDVEILVKNKKFWGSSQIPTTVSLLPEKPQSEIALNLAFRSMSYSRKLQAFGSASETPKISLPQKKRPQSASPAYKRNTRQIPTPHPPIQSFTQKMRNRSEKQKNRPISARIHRVTTPVNNNRRRSNSVSIMIPTKQGNNGNNRNSVEFDDINSSDSMNASISNQFDQSDFTMSHSPVITEIDSEEFKKDRIWNGRLRKWVNKNNIPIPLKEAIDIEKEMKLLSEKKNYLYFTKKDKEREEDEKLYDNSYYEKKYSTDAGIGSTLTKEDKDRLSTLPLSISHIVPKSLIQFCEQYTMDVRSFQSCISLGPMKIHEAHRFCKESPNILVTSLSFDLLWMIMHTLQPKYQRTFEILFLELLKSIYCDVQDKVIPILVNKGLKLNLGGLLSRLIHCTPYYMIIEDNMNNNNKIRDRIAYLKEEVNNLKEELKRDICYVMYAKKMWKYTTEKLILMALQDYRLSQHEARVKQWYKLAVISYLPINEYDVKYKNFVAWRRAARPGYDLYCERQIQITKQMIIDHPETMRKNYERRDELCSEYIATMETRRRMEMSEMRYIEQLSKELKIRENTRHDLTLKTIRTFSDVACHTTLIFNRVVSNVIKIVSYYPDLVQYKENFDALRYQNLALCNITDTTPITDSIKLWLMSFENKSNLSHIQFIDAHSRDRAYLLCINLEIALHSIGLIPEDIKPTGDDERVEVVCNTINNIWKNSIDQKRFLIKDENEISEFSHHLEPTDFHTPNPLLIWSTICRLFLTYPNYDITPIQSVSQKRLFDILECMGESSEELIKHPPPMTIMDDFWSIEENKANNVIPKIIPSILLYSQMFQLLEDKHLEVAFNQHNYTLIRDELKRIIGFCDKLVSNMNDSILEMRDKGSRYSELYAEVEKEIWRLLGKESLRKSYPVYAFEMKRVMKEEKPLTQTARRKRKSFGVEAGIKCLDLLSDISEVNELEKEIEYNEIALQDLYRYYRNEKLLNNTGLIKLIKDSNILNNSEIKLNDIWSIIRRGICYKGDFKPIDNKNKNNNNKENDKRKMYFSPEQFTEILIRISHLKYPEENLLSSFSMLLYRDLIGYSHSSDINDFRQQILHPFVQKELENNKSNLLYLFERYCISSKSEYSDIPSQMRVLKEDEWNKFILDYRLNECMSENELNRIFYEIQGGKCYIGPIAEALEENQINYSEFLEGIIVLSVYKYRNPFVDLSLKLKMFLKDIFEKGI